MMGKNMVFYDVDCTLTYRNEAFIFATELAKSDSIDRGAYARLQEVEADWKKNAISQDTALSLYITILSEGLKGRDVAEITRIARDFSKTIEIREVLAAEIRELRHHGCSTALISGTPNILLEQLYERLPATYLTGADLPHQNGTFTGEKPNRFMTSDVKEQVVLGYIERGFVPFAGYGDSMGDMGILKHVLHPVAVNPRDELAAEAKSRGWTIWRDGEKFTSVTEMIKRETAEA